MKNLGWLIAALWTTTIAAGSEPPVEEKWRMILMFHDALTCTEARKSIAEQPLKLDCPDEKSRRFAYTVHYAGIVPVKEFNKKLRKTKALQSILLGAREDGTSLFAPKLGTVR